MPVNFQILALNTDEFTRWWAMSDAELKQFGAKRLLADSDTGYPCRVSLEDASKGEQVLAITYKHHEVDSFYQSSGPIYVRKRVSTAYPAINSIPAFLNKRLISIRAYNEKAYMRYADAVSGEQLKQEMLRLFSDPVITYVQLHNARTGCYLCQAMRL